MSLLLVSHGSLTWPTTVSQKSRCHQLSWEIRAKDHRLKPCECYWSSSHRWELVLLWGLLCLGLAVCSSWFRCLHFSLLLEMRDSWEGGDRCVSVMVNKLKNIKLPAAWRLCMQKINGTEWMSSERQKTRRCHRHLKCCTLKAQHIQRI